MRSVHELTQDELLELRERWFYQHVDDGSIDEVVGRNVGSPDDIAMDVVKAYYECTSFVDEDFFCNINERD